ncbi:MAG: helix-turn-helix transcriptional regulator [Clostridia bacterium]|nr:helix-turn-helix transcriptional regulator [Clostridia bacterium]
MEIERLRKATKLTQQEVADMLKIARTTYQSYEKGRNEPSIEHLINLSKLFNVSVDTLIGNKRSSSPQKNELLEIIDRLTDTECKKLVNYAEGIIINRNAEQREKQKKILSEEE